MKAEINNENKAKFFALYWGQEIVKYGYVDWRQPNTGMVSDRMFFEFKRNSNDDSFFAYLLLKPLSQIINDEAIHVGLIHIDGLHPMKTEWIRDYLNDEAELTYKEVDYLRSKGYALPWMGLSVDEMVNAGWIKLTEQ